MSDEEDELRTLGKKDIEEDPRFNTLFSRLELENRFDLFLICIFVKTLNDGKVLFRGVMNDDIQ